MDQVKECGDVWAMLDCLSEDDKDWIEQLPEGDRNTLMVLIRAGGDRGFDAEGIVSTVRQFDLKMAGEVILASTKGERTAGLIKDKPTRLRKKREARGIIGRRNQERSDRIRGMDEVYRLARQMSGYCWLNLVEEGNDDGETSALLLLDGPNKEGLVICPRGERGYAEAMCWLVDPRRRHEETWKPLHFAGDPSGKRRWTQIKSVCDAIKVKDTRASGGVRRSAAVSLVKSAACNAVAQLRHTGCPGWTKLELPDDGTPDLSNIEDEKAKELLHRYFYTNPEGDAVGVDECVCEQ